MSILKKRNISFIEAAAVYSSNIAGNSMDLNSFIKTKSIREKIKKDFRRWHIKKEKLHNEETRGNIYFHEKEI